MKLFTPILPNPQTAEFGINRARKISGLRKVFVCVAILTSSLLQVSAGVRDYYTTLNPYYKSGFGGQCTAYVWGRAYERNSGLWLITKGNAYPSAKFWWSGTTPTSTSGLSANIKHVESQQPAANSLAIWAGDSTNTHGHIAYVESWDGTSVSFTEANIKTFSSTKYGGGVDDEGRVKKLSLSSFRSRGKGIGALLGFVHLNPTPNRIPSFSGVRASASHGSISVLGGISDPDGDPLNQLDAWLVDSRGVVVSGSMKRLLRPGISIQEPSHGTLTIPSFSLSWNSQELSAILANSGTISVRLRGFDNRGGRAEIKSNGVFYSKPAPEIDVFFNSSPIQSYGYAPSILSRVGSTATQFLTVRNTGTANLVITSISSSNRAFAGSVRTTISPGGSATLTIRFSPSSRGTVNGHLRILSNDSDESLFVIQLVGRGA